MCHTNLIWKGHNKIKYRICTIQVNINRRIIRYYLDSSLLRSTACCTTLRFFPQRVGSNESKKSANSCSLVVSNKQALTASFRSFSALSLSLLSVCTSKLSTSRSGVFRSLSCSSSTLRVNNLKYKDN